MADLWVPAGRAPTHRPCAIICIIPANASPLVRTAITNTKPAIRDPSTGATARQSHLPWVSCVRPSPAPCVRVVAAEGGVQVRGRVVLGQREGVHPSTWVRAHTASYRMRRLSYIYYSNDLHQALHSCRRGRRSHFEVFCLRCREIERRLVAKLARRLRSDDHGHVEHLTSTLVHSVPPPKADIG